jgi:hypothetical protein
MVFASQSLKPLSCDDGRHANRGDRVSLSRSVTLADAIDVATNMGRSLFEADVAGLWLLGVDRQTLHLAGHHGFTTAGVSRFDAVPVAASTPISEAVRTGEPVFAENQQILIDQYSKTADLVRQIGAAALSCAPSKSPARSSGFSASAINRNGRSTPTTSPPFGPSQRSLVKLSNARASTPSSRRPRSAPTSPVKRNPRFSRR